MSKLGEVMNLRKSFYSPHEVAELAGVHPSTVLNYIASGRLYAVKLSARTYRIPVRAVISLLEPAHVARSSLTIDPDADVQDELEREGAPTSLPA
jgi:excisionase family DNA binding protein